MTNRGISLVEVLVAGAIASVIMLGSAQSIIFAMQSGAVSKAILTENDFRLTVNKALDGQDDLGNNKCKNNLDISEDNKKLKTEDVVVPVEGLNFEGESVITVGDFKNEIEVVKMEVKTKGANDVRERTGNFIIYYKKKNLGNLNTVARQICGPDPDDPTKLKLDGCFTKKCNLDYTVDDSDTTDTNEFDCKVLDCHDFNLPKVALSGYPCPWGQLYRKTGTTKCASGKSPPCCDTVEKHGACSPHTQSLKTGKVDSGDGKTCACEEKYRQTADGRCVYFRYNVFPFYNSYNNKMDYDTSGNDAAERNDHKESCLKFNDNTHEGAYLLQETVRNEQLDRFCGKDTENPYRGRFNCIEWRDPGEAYHKNCNGNGRQDNYLCIIYWRRFYNRETGKAHCIRYIHFKGHGESDPERKRRHEAELRAFFSIPSPTQ